MIINKEMETILLKLPYYKEMSQEDLINIATITKVTPNDKELIDGFLLNHFVKHIDIGLDNAYKCSIIENGIECIVGLFVFGKNDIRTKFPIEQEDTIPRNYNELLFLFLHDRLFNEPFLTHSFRIIFQSLVTCDSNQEVFWFAQNNNLFSRVTDVVAKQHPDYCFINESEYFSKHIIENYQFLINKEQSLLGKLKQKDNIPRS